VHSITTSNVIHLRPKHIREVRSPSATRRREHIPSDAERVLVEILGRARAGDDRAWERLHDRFTPMLRGIARSYRLAPSDVDDVVQTTWLRLFDHIGRLRDPAAVPGWLATTARRECLRLLQVPLREYPTADPDLGAHDKSADPERELLAVELRAVLERAFATLPRRHRQLMTLLVAQPTMNYQELSRTLKMPIGSIGPIRARSMARLRCHLELRRLCSSDC
jgi:RNA polymerase sigma factor (sigma-70 family)